MFSRWYGGVSTGGLVELLVEGEAGSVELWGVVLRVA